jgi:hypothetical protein
MTLWPPPPFGRGDGGEDCGGEHDQGGVAVPAVPPADLALVETDSAFRVMETIAADEYISAGKSREFQEILLWWFIRRPGDGLCRYTSSTQCPVPPYVKVA